MRLGVLSDLHWSTDPLERGSWHNPYQFGGVAARISEALGWFEDQQVDVVAILGDIAHRGDPASLRECLAQFASAESPVLVVSGNHDLAEGTNNLVSALDAAAAGRVMLAAGQGRSFDRVRVAGVHVGLSTDWFGARLREHPPVEDWSSDPVVLLSHYPLLSRASLLARHGWPYPGDLLDRGEVEAELRRRVAPTIVLSGHIHARDVHSVGPILQLAQAAVVEPPFDATVVEVAQSPLTVNRNTYRLPGVAASREPALATEEGVWTYDGERWTSTEKRVGS
jgi:hypothetical protein